jgi:hypothetical protein
MTGFMQILVAGGIDLTITGPSAVSGSRSTLGTCVSTVANMVLTGGAGGPYTYVWNLVSGGTGITITSSTSQDTSFSGNVGPGTPTLSGSYAVTVTDATTGASATSQSVAVTLSYIP